MAKDPAILFYTSDFLTGTMLMSDQQKGRYITALCMQHQKERLSEKDIIQICGGERDEELFAKFNKDELGYYNVRLEQEIIKRRKFTESRRRNLKGKRKSSHKNSLMETHMENENENENEGESKKLEKNNIELVSELDDSEDTYEKIAYTFWQLFITHRKSLGVTPTTLMKSKVVPWVSAVKKMVEIDKRKEDEILEVFRFLQRDLFWAKNIQSTQKLREHFERLLVEARDKTGQSNKGIQNSISGYQDTYYEAIKIINKDE